MTSSSHSQCLCRDLIFLDQSRLVDEIFRANIRLLSVEEDGFPRLGYCCLSPQL